MTLNKTLLILLLSVAFLISTSCSTISKTASDITAYMMRDGSPIVEEESDPYIAETAGLALLKTMEVFAHHNPNNKIYRTLLAKNYANYAFGILENKLLMYEGSDPERYETILRRAKLFYARGRDYGLDVLNNKSSFKKSLKGKLPKFKKAVNSISRNNIAPLFWTAFAWGGLINLSKDNPMAIVELGRVEVMMARAAEIDNTFFYGGPHLFYGVYYGSRPPLLGGNLKKAKENFDKAVALTHGNFLFAKTLYAQFYAVQAQDKALFKSLMSEVISADPGALPEQRLANILAQERAQVLLRKKAEFFN